jgi:hypothetical protein
VLYRSLIELPAAVVNAFWVLRHQDHRVVVVVGYGVGQAELHSAEDGRNDRAYLQVRELRGRSINNTIQA